MDAFDEMAQRARQAVALTDVDGNPVPLTQEQRAAVEVRAYAHMCQKLVEAYPAEALEFFKPTVMVFTSYTDRDKEEPQVYAGVLMHVCGAGTPKHALELLARTLYQRIQEQVAAKG